MEEREERMLYLHEWHELTCQTIENVVKDKGVKYPRVELSLSEEMLLELTLHYKHAGVNLCFETLKKLSELESLYQTQFLTENERYTLNRLKEIANLKCHN